MSRERAQWLAIALLATTLTAACIIGYMMTTGELREIRADLADSRARAATRVDIDMMQARLNSMNASLQRRALDERTTAAAIADAKERADKADIAAGRAQAEAYRARAKALEPCVIHGIC